MENTITNRNGRKGSLTSWNNKAVESFKQFYALYSQFKQRIYLEEKDILFLLSCYNGKMKNNNSESKKAIMTFFARQFKLMGYPQENNSKLEQRKGYIEIERGLIILDFGFNEDKINKALFDEYFKNDGKKAENCLTEKNEAHNSPIIVEKQEDNNKLLAERVYKKRFKRFIEKHKRDLDIYDVAYNQDLKGGWE